jgi:TetR/AcrR family transcriptional regulator, transcriptional repressor for nem operon
VVDSGESEPRARAIFAAVAGAQLMARSRCDISLFDSLIDSYRAAGLLPA